ncbi:MAG: RluA family pseudouridine synthase [Lachnospiraceae bacterium]|nr:RluA family pseudouridine synthase [Lachnospiraceae bacterium]
MERRLRYVIKPEYDGYTIEKYLKLKRYSHGCLVHLKKTEEGIKRNGVWAYTKDVLQAGDVLETVFVEEEASENIVAVEMTPDIVYEDEDILVINKAADTPIHPSQGNYENSLANGVAGYFKHKGENFVFRCINRLDRDTTGLVVIAKNMLSGAVLNQAMIQREIHRIYLAVVKGELPESGTIDFPIARKGGSTIERCVNLECGERAVTHFQCVEKNEKYSLAKIWLETGRTHQIRVHMNAIGYPLPGDFLYHPDFSEIGRQALHSWRLEFMHPVTGALMKFEQPLPEDMRKLL